MSENHTTAEDMVGIFEKMAPNSQDNGPIPFRWRLWTPYGKWLFVMADARVKETAGGILLPDKQVGIEKVMEGTGRIVRIGNSEEVLKGAGVPLEPGMRICYRGFLKDVFQFDREKEDDNRIVFMLRAEDVMAIIGEDVTMGAFS